jgi:hypothetical protein
MITYDQIKQLAVEEGVSVTNLIALARQNDPFYCGSNGQVEKGRWFAGLWQQLVLSLSKGSATLTAATCSVSTTSTGESRAVHSQSDGLVMFAGVVRVLQYVS